MEELMALLKDGRSRSLEMIALELHRSVGQIRRDIEFLERTGMIRRIVQPQGGAPSCSGCDGCAPGKTCPGCMPEGGFQNMGTMWEVVM